MAVNPSPVQFVAVRSMDDVLEAALTRLPSEHRPPATGEVPADPGIQLSQ